MLKELLLRFIRMCSLAPCERKVVVDFKSFGGKSTANDQSVAELHQQQFNIGRGKQYVIHGRYSLYVTEAYWAKLLQPVFQQFRTEHKFWTNVEVSNLNGKSKTAFRNAVRRYYTN